ncbi:MAG: ATP-binding cassette domain-containing protein [Ignavibacteriales bacterium]|nr:ATP-binding cassette domain-containing protein [Ignavibacteriales bacterium]MCF8435240.1 ATP-binding cassette domain-containing protein [Ignavibacteriales bacterium]
MKFDFPVISKQFSDDSGVKIRVLNKIKLSLPDKSITTIIAPLGSGKSTLIKILSGNVSPDDTTSNLNELIKQVFKFPENGFSLPWLSPAENIKFLTGTEDEILIEKVLSECGLEGYENHLPHIKSTGFRLRTLLACLLIKKPALIVADDPFRNILPAIKIELLILLRKLILKNELNFFLATTNISEAIFLSDKIYLMKKNPGEIIEEFSIEPSGYRDVGFFDSNQFSEQLNKIQNLIKSIENQRLINFII